MPEQKKRSIQVNPLDVTESLGYTTFRRDSRKPWTKEEDETLKQIIGGKLVAMGYAEGLEALKKTDWNFNAMALPQQIDWEEISAKIKTRKPKDCRKRWLNSLDPTLRKGKWTPAEDKQLIDAFAMYGSSWQKISLEIPGRTDDQCAKRYVEVLDPNTRDRLRPWTEQEDLSLIRKVKAYGTKWRAISAEMESRPSLTCRNRWRKIVTDVVRGKASDDVKEAIDSIQGGLSKVEEISETLKKDVIAKKAQQTLDIESTSSRSNNTVDTRKKKTRAPTLKAVKVPVDYQRPPLDPPSVPSVEENTNNVSNQATTQVDWKFTLKDSSGFSVSSGVIANTELATQLIEAIKQNDLKISIHQHIHHHYSSTLHNSGNGYSVSSKQGGSEDSNSNTSGNNMYSTSNNNTNEDGLIPNRSTHFNYLPPMVQPQLGSSSQVSSKESDLSKLLNPHPQHSHHNHTHQHQHLKQHQQLPHHQHSLNHQQQLNKRRYSASSNESTRKKERRLSSERRAAANEEYYEELDGEVDFWEKMGTLSGMPTNYQNDIMDTEENAKFSMMYGVFAEEEEYDIEELEEELRGIAGILPFNPS